MVNYYKDLTGDLIILNQKIPFIVKGNLEVNPDISGIRLLNNHSIFKNGIRFNNLITELFSYFNSWTVSITIETRELGELWDECNILEISNSDFKICLDNNIEVGLYDINNSKTYNYLYKGYSPTLNNNLGVVSYLAYEIDKSNVVTKNIGKLTISHTFTKKDNISGDLIIKSPIGTLHNTIIKELIINTTDIYTGYIYNTESIYKTILYIEYKTEDIYNIDLLNIIYTAVQPKQYAADTDGLQKLLDISYLINGPYQYAVDTDGIQKLLDISYLINGPYQYAADTNGLQKLLDISYDVAATYSFKLLDISYVVKISSNEHEIELDNDDDELELLFSYPDPEKVDYIIDTTKNIEIVDTDL